MAQFHVVQHHINAKNCWWSTAGLGKGGVNSMTFPHYPKTTQHHSKVLGEIPLGYRDVDAGWGGKALNSPGGSAGGPDRTGLH